MESTTQRITRENKFREYINQFLQNKGWDCDDTWWRGFSAGDGLRRLAGAGPINITDSMELGIEGGKNIVFVSWCGGSSTDALEGLFHTVEEYICQLANKNAPASAGDASSKPQLKKFETVLLFFIKDIKSRIALEMKFKQEKARISQRIRKTTQMASSIGCAYVIRQEYHGEKAYINGINRHESLQMPPTSANITSEHAEKACNDCPSALVVTAQLKQLVELYNLVGDQLFRNNVRFGIKESFDVSGSIRKTLMEEPEHFWFKNNGVTLLIENPDFQLRSTDELQLGALEPEKPPLFSIVNGAQTITTAARYAFELEYRKLNHPDEKDICAELLEKFERAQVLLRVIHVPVETEDGMAEADQAEAQKAAALARDISVALNRQKPIKQEDIAFATPFVEKLTEYLGNPQSNAPFQLVRRGEENIQYPQLGLVDFSRARLACAGSPGTARTASRNSIMKTDFDTGAFQEKRVFVEDWEQAEEDREAIFRRYYGAVWFAYQTAQKYVEVSKSLNGSTPNADTAIKNGKWYFTALTVQILNGFQEAGDGHSDFSNFNHDLESIEKVLPDAIIAFADIAASCVGGGQMLDSNDFKKDTLYHTILKKLKQPDRNQALFQNFLALFGAAAPATDGAPEESSPSKKSGAKITHISLGGSTAKISVASAAEAMQRTVQYILNTHSPQKPLLKQTCDDWLTDNSSKAHAGDGYFRRQHVIVHNYTKYWLGTSSNSRTKYAQMRKLCQLAQVPQRKIVWFSDSSEVFVS